MIHQLQGGPFIRRVEIIPPRAVPISLLPSAVRILQAETIVKPAPVNSGEIEPLMLSRLNFAETLLNVPVGANAFLHEVNFSEGEAPGEKIISTVDPGGVVRSVGIAVNDLFSDPLAEFSIGVDGDVERYMTRAESQSSRVSFYYLEFDVNVSIQEEIKVYWTGSGMAGRGKASLLYYYT